MTARRPRVHLCAKPDFRAVLSSAELHDVIVCADEPVIVMCSDSESADLWRESGPFGPTYFLPRAVTDQYVDAYEAFADLRTYFQTAAARLSIDLSPRDAGLLRLLGGRRLPEYVSEVSLSFDWQTKRVAGVVAFDDARVGDRSYTPQVGLSRLVYFTLPSDRGAQHLHARIVDYIYATLTPCHLLPLSADEVTRYRASSTPPLAPHWRLSTRDQPCRPGEMRLLLGADDLRSMLAASQDFRVHLYGPAAYLREQMSLILSVIGRVDELAFLRPTAAHFVQVEFDEQLHPDRWPAVSGRIVQAVAALAQLEPRLSSYVMFWIVDRLPGCVFHPELRKLRCVEATAARIRAKLDERLNGPGPVNSKR